MVGGSEDGGKILGIDLDCSPSRDFSQGSSQEMGKRRERDKENKSKREREIKVFLTKPESRARSQCQAGVSCSGGYLTS